MRIGLDELKADIRLRVWHRIQFPIPNPRVPEDHDPDCALYVHCGVWVFFGSCRGPCQLRISCSEFLLWEREFLCSSNEIHTGRHTGLPRYRQAQRVLQCTPMTNVHRTPMVHRLRKHSLTSLVCIGETSRFQDSTEQRA